MILKRFSDFSGNVLESRKWLLFLVVANLTGFFYGVWYYLPQLYSTNPFLWIVALDSPISVLLFAVVCSLLLLKKRIPEFLKLITITYVIKYGLWTMLVIWLYWPGYFSAFQPEVHFVNFFLHGGMVLEGAVLVFRTKPKIKAVLTVSVLMVLNDFCDYVLFGTYTRIPPTFLWLLFPTVLAMSVLIPLIVFYRCRR